MSFAVLSSLDDAFGAGGSLADCLKAALITVCKDNSLEYTNSGWLWSVC